MVTTAAAGPAPIFEAPGYAASLAEARIILRAHDSRRQRHVFANLETWPERQEPSSTIPPASMSLH